MGVAAGGLSPRQTLLTAISGALAGAISMCSGEFIATRSQNQVMKGELKLEVNHIEEYHEEEIAELNSLLPLIGITENEAGTLQESIISFYDTNPKALLKIMSVLEFGVLTDELRSPVKAGLYSFILFILGSLPSVLPFAFVDEAITGIIIAAVLTIVGLLVVGAVKTYATRGNFWSSSIENFVVAGVGGGLAFGVGKLFEYAVGE
jgi:VIT1/CCC1 family predicted Fe2+/Mn2+ transporter